MIINGFGNGSGALKTAGELLESKQFVYTISKISNFTNIITNGPATYGAVNTGSVNLTSFDVSSYMSKYQVLSSRMRITNLSGTLSATANASSSQTGTFVFPWAFQLKRYVQQHRASGIGSNYHEAIVLVNKTSTAITTGSKTYTWTLNITNFPSSYVPNGNNYRWLYRFGPMYDGNSWAVCDGGYTSGYYEAEFLVLSPNANSRGGIFSASGTNYWLDCYTGKDSNWPSGTLSANDFSIAQDVSWTVTGYLDVYGY